ncbi:hypothetical protein ACE7GA_21290 [Roseomonas sp. CCTCC AB2023176]|uniref:hypothetical protein n=1 Tax=Roseomonas sp. CCTCC AB2023176 TaxID=3342640 RepID=UPI0035DFF258
MSLTITTSRYSRSPAPVPNGRWTEVMVSRSLDDEVLVSALAIVIRYVRDGREAAADTVLTAILTRLRPGHYLLAGELPEQE